MPAKSKRQVVGEFRRTEIINAARTIFARKGFAKGIIDEIAREAGIAKGTVYLYFQSKTEIYKAVLDHDIARLQQVTLSRIDSAAGLREKLWAFIATRLENVESRKAFFRIMDSVQENLSMTRRQYRELFQEPVGRMKRAIESAIASGEIRAVDAEKTAWVIADMTRGIIQRRLLTPNDCTPDEDARFLLDLIWTALTGHFDAALSIPELPPISAASALKPAATPRKRSRSKVAEA